MKAPREIEEIREQTQLRYKVVSEIKMTMRDSIAMAKIVARAYIRDRVILKLMTIMVLVTITKSQCLYNKTNGVMYVDYDGCEPLLAERNKNVDTQCSCISKEETPPIEELRELAEQQLWNSLSKTYQRTGTSNYIVLYGACEYGRPISEAIINSDHSGVSPDAVVEVDRGISSLDGQYYVRILYGIAPSIDDGAVKIETHTITLELTCPTREVSTKYLPSGKCG